MQKRRPVRQETELSRGPLVFFFTRLQLYLDGTLLERLKDIERMRSTSPSPRVVALAAICVLGFIDVARALWQGGRECQDPKNVNRMSNHSRDELFEKYISILEKLRNRCFISDKLSYLESTVAVCMAPAPPPAL